MAESRRHLPILQMIASQFYTIHLIFSGEKPVGCSICQKRFVTVNNVRQHVKTVHNIKYSRGLHLVTYTSSGHVTALIGATPAKVGTKQVPPGAIISGSEKNAPKPDVKDANIIQTATGNQEQYESHQMVAMETNNHHVLQPLATVKLTEGISVGSVAMENVNSPSNQPMPVPMVKPPTTPVPMAMTHPGAIATSNPASLATSPQPPHHTPTPAPVSAPVSMPTIANAIAMDSASHGMSSQSYASPMHPPVAMQHLPPEHYPGMAAELVRATSRALYGMFPGSAPIAVPVSGALSEAPGASGVVSGTVSGSHAPDNSGSMLAVMEAVSMAATTTQSVSNEPQQSNVNYATTRI